MMRIRHLRPVLSLPALWSLMGCVLWIREPAAYQEELVELVEPREDPIQACFDKLLDSSQMAIEAEEREEQGPYEDIGPTVAKRMKELSGMVVMKFTVAPKTGVVTAEVDESKTTAPPEVRGCVEEAVKDLQIEPGDHKQGQAVLAFRLDVGKPGTHRPDGAPTQP